MEKVKNLRLKIHNVNKKTGIGTINVVYSFNGKEKYYTTNVGLHGDKWDKEKKQPKHKAITEVQDQNNIKELFGKIAKIIRDHQTANDGLMPSITYVDEHITKKEQLTDIYELFDQYLREVEKRLEPDSVKNYQSALNLLKEVDKYYKYCLSLQNFNYNFIQKFVEYCQHLKEQKNTNATVNYRIAIFKGFVKWLSKKEIKHNIKVENWGAVDNVSVTVDMLCLEREELNEILAYQCSGKREQRIKDIIVWLSHTGMRVSDVKRITKNHIMNGNIDFIPSKTKKRVKGGVRAVIPISKPVQDILDRYNYKIPHMDKSNVQKSIRKFCAKITSLQNIIRHIEEDGVMVVETFVPKYSVLTSHAIGRKTFINLCVEKSVPIPTIMGMTGHLTMDTVIKSYLHKHRNALPQLQNVFEF